MFKPVTVANKSWWVPESNGMMLAVKLTDPENYDQAIHWKMESLIEKMGLDKAAKVANRKLRQEGALTLDRTYNSEHLADQVLQNSMRISCTIREGAPERANPATPDEAKATVEAQSDLDWENFLT